MHTKFLTDFMAEKVPVTAAMGIEVVESNSDGVKLKAPISANINDKGVAFGGSLFSVASLCSWAVVDSIIQQNNLSANVFIHTSQTKFSAPVINDFTVTCKMPDQSAISQFLETFKRKGRARLSLIATIYEGDVIAFESISDYVAVRKS